MYDDVMKPRVLVEQQSGTIIVEDLLYWDADDEPTVPNILVGTAFTKPKAWHWRLRWWLCDMVASVAFWIRPSPEVD